ncbi:uncharacterized protein K489DRAFT_313915 [Dissoconium aciculare CBS 342.82]|uniref:Uncharacterized protein n=1 Tax=Dissoconium aciculare CBS 342.82 TaxID=1314786 RepID=A0A6J3MD19_9PEZI|nr:uncharacterized protein K489DRAFT_313915 [Dissoconium aciculare CBS 342.82]KAF1825489.1 hypothetical protein K489DRAFT_313915 [Dissoconium aciculare CBS 342.82]
MAAIQLNFTLRTSANCKTVHLLGSWDNYTGQLPLSKDSSKTGGWKGAFRFQSQTLKQGQRYWYYYIIDGYHVSHDPARDSVVEPTTGRKLNVLDVPAGKASEKESRQSRRASAAVPKGRPVEKSQIVCPRPCKPQETKLIRTMAFPTQTMEQIAAQFASTHLESEDEESDSDADSDVPSLASSVSSMTSSCSCERYGITRAGDRVKLDCGGSRCGYSDDDCSDDEEVPAPRACNRRHGMIMSA